jgi:hypothetical protein
MTHTQQQVILGVLEILWLNELFYSTKKTDTMNYYYGGKYIIVHKLISSSSCVTIYSDTVILTQPPKVILAKADSFACYGTTFYVKIKGYCW